MLVKLTTVWTNANSNEFDDIGEQFYWVFFKLSLTNYLCQCLSLSLSLSHSLIISLIFLYLSYSPTPPPSLPFHTHYLLILSPFTLSILLSLSNFYSLSPLSLTHTHTHTHTHVSSLSNSWSPFFTKSLAIFVDKLTRSTKIIRWSFSSKLVILYLPPSLELLLMM